MNQDPTPVATLQVLAPAPVRTTRKHHRGLPQQYPGPRRTVLSADVPLIDRLFGDLL